MAEFVWRAPLEGVMVAGRHGEEAGEPGVVVRALRRTLFSISPRKGRRAEVSEAAGRLLGMILPEPGSFAGDGSSTLLWSGYNQWLLAGPPGGGGTTFARLAAELDGLAAVVDHSDGRAVLRVSGPAARRVLARLDGVDLDPRAFGPGRCAATRLAHVGALLHQVDAAPTFEIHVFRAFAASFFHELTEAASEFGILVQP